MALPLDGRDEEEGARLRRHGEAEPLLAESSAVPPAFLSEDRAAPPLRAFLALMLLVNLAAGLYALPVNRVIERRLCAEHYGVGAGTDVDEAACKVDAVQRGLAGLQGVMETAWVVGDFAVTIPLGFVARRRGRRAVLLLNVVPRVALAAWALAVDWWPALLPTRAIAAASFLSVLGGDCVFGSLMYSLAAGMARDAVERASFFGYMGSVSYVVALAGPALSSATMGVALWLPLCLSIGLLLLCVPAIARLPDGRDADVPPAGLHAGTAKPPSVAAAVAAQLHALAAIVRSHPRNFFLLLVGFLLTAFASTDTKLLTQYISKRYAWTFAQAGYLLSSKAVVNFVLLAVVVPRFLRRRARRAAAHPHRQNLRLARACLAVSVVGAAAIALSASVAALVPALLVYALGSVLPVFTLSLLKAPAVVLDGDHGASDTQIFAIVMLAKTLGSLLGAPVMAALWVWGITHGGFALGAPYFVSAALYLVAIGVFAGITVD